jgi:hypothetical protein
LEKLQKKAEAVKRPMKSRLLAKHRAAALSAEPFQTMMAF